MELVRLPLPLLRVRRGRFFDRDIWPESCVFRIERQPFLKPGLAISLDGIDGAFRFANATVDAFLRMDDEHVLALVEAVHGAHLDAVHRFAANAAIVDNVGQLSILPQPPEDGANLFRSRRPLDAWAALVSRFPGNLGRVLLT